MLSGITLQDLRSQMEEHLLMVEEVLGGLDLYIQKLEKRLERMELLLGLEDEGVSTRGVLAEIQRLSNQLAQLRSR